MLTDHAGRRVQFKRMLESEGADVTINGNAVGSQGGVGLAMPKTRSKSSAANGAAKTPSSSDKKRKGNEEGATTTEVASIEETFGQKDKESAVKKKPKTFKAPRTPKLSQRAVPLKGEEAQTRADELA